MRFGRDVLSSFVCVGCVLALVALFYPPLRAKILSIEPWTADWRTTLLSDRTATPYPGLAIVIISNKTLAGYRYTSPTPRDLIAKVVRTVDAAKPSVIGLDFYFIRPTDADRELVDQLRKTEAPVVIGAVDRRYPQFSASEFAFERDFLKSTGREAGYNELKHEKDDVVRYTATPVDPDYPASFALLVAQTQRHIATDVASRIAWLRGPGANLDPFVTIAAESLLEGHDASNAQPPKDLAQSLKGKIVLISGEYPYLDRHRTPLSISTAESMLGVRVHAAVIAQLLDGRRYSELDAVEQELLLVGLIAAGILLGWFFWRRRVDFLSLGVATAALIVIDAFVFTTVRVALPFTLAVWAWFISATLGHHAHTVVASMRARK